jgi:feruloyl esterase
MGGSVVTITDAGHSVETLLFATNPDGSFNETLFADFAERSQHEMALKTKALIKAFWAAKKRNKATWSGCHGWQPGVDGGARTRIRRRARRRNWY